MNHRNHWTKNRRTDLEISFAILDYLAATPYEFTSARILSHVADLSHDKTVKYCCHLEDFGLVRQHPTYHVHYQITRAGRKILA